MGFTDYISDAAKTVKNATSDAISATEKRFKLIKLNSELDEMYKTLGKIRYTVINDSVIATEEEIKLCDEISRLIEEIRELRMQKNCCICNNCSNKISRNDAFCPFCGIKI